MRHLSCKVRNYRDINDRRLGQSLQILWSKQKDGVRMACGSPYLAESKQAAVDQGDWFVKVSNRRYAADRKAGAGFDEWRIGSANLANQSRHARFINAAVACRDYKHSHIVRLAPEHDALGDLPERHAQRISCLLRRTRGGVQQPRRVRMIVRLQNACDMLRAVRQRMQLSVAHRWIHTARIMRDAC
jgi:hypothetical protein